MVISLDTQGCLNLVEAMFRHARQEAQRGDRESREWLNSPDARHWAALCGIDVDRMDATPALAPERSAGASVASVFDDDLQGVALNPAVRPIRSAARICVKQPQRESATTGVR
jgi:hypothetical protein